MTAPTGSRRRRDLLRRAGVQAVVAQAAVIAALIQQPSTYPLPQYRPSSRRRWHYVLNGMVQMGNLTAQQAATMKFPKLGDNVPQSFGTDVWDPYVMDMVENELTAGLPLQPAADLQRRLRHHAPASTTRRWPRSTRRSGQNEERIDDSARPVRVLHARGAALENPANGAIEALYPGPGYHRVEVQRDRARSSRQGVPRDRLRGEHGRLHPGAGRLLVQAVHPGHWPSSRA